MPKKIVLVIASNGFQQEEYHETYKVLVKAGFHVTTASDKQGHATAHDGTTVIIDSLIDDIVSTVYDGVFLIGGRGALKFLNTPLVHKLLNELFCLSKPYGAICIAPRILAQAFVLRHKKATCWDGDDQAAIVLKKYEVEFVNEPVVVDGNVITANGPLAAQAFGQAIAALVA